MSYTKFIGGQVPDDQKTPVTQIGLFIFLIHPLQFNFFQRQLLGIQIVCAVGLA